MKACCIECLFAFAPDEKRTIGSIGSQPNSFVGVIDRHLRLFASSKVHSTKIVALKLLVSVLPSGNFVIDAHQILFLRV